MAMKVQNIGGFSEGFSYTFIRGATIRLTTIIVDFVLALGVQKYKVTENRCYMV